MGPEMIVEKLRELRLVPVVKLDRVEDAAALSDALMAGGLPAAEITFRTDAAEASIRLVKERHPDMLVGAGTVTTVEQAQRAIEAGAEFLVSPGLDLEVVRFAQDKGVAILPGCCTPSEIMAAMAAGLNVLKFFPANLFGGVKGIKALAPVFPKVRFMPTGGVNSDNLLEFLSCEPILAVGGSWMVKDSLIQAGDFEKIAALSREAVEKIKSMG